MSYAVNNRPNTRILCGELGRRPTAFLFSSISGVPFGPGCIAGATKPAMPFPPIRVAIPDAG